MHIALDDLSGEEIAEFLEAHVREVRLHVPFESKRALSLEDLRKPEIKLWVVREGERIVGCGAVKKLNLRHAELKSIRTRPTRKRSGVASLLLNHILAEAKQSGFEQVSLETGTSDYFRPARMLYKKFGFIPCGPFAEYHPDPNNTFMTKRL
ncbi:MULTISPECIES: GNAT family N-acetyltransferase [unclassified Streptomyces]|uniref:GNAT family N-acetyltransferase n=1 Tax=Streptomyces sp. NPDC127532 TaxID=3345399 RepID=UPI0036302E34